MANNSDASGWAWLAVYFFFNLSLTIYNKAVMQFYKFSFPWALTGVHTLCSAMGCYLLAVFGIFTPARLSRNESLVMLSFSVLYTINIAISNVSLNEVTVPFHQVVRSTTPVFVLIINYLWLGVGTTRNEIFSLILVIVGVMFATYGDYNATTWGFLLTVLGTMLAALKTVVTNRVQVGGLKLHPLDLLLRMSPLAAIQCMIYMRLTGELDLVRAYIAKDFTSGHFWAIFLNGCIAFGLNVASFTANKKTGALTMSVAANVKQVLSIVLSVIIFSLSISFMNGFGITITLCGGAVYSFFEYQKKRARAGLIPVPTSARE